MRYTGSSLHYAKATGTYIDTSSQEGSERESLLTTAVQSSRDRSYRRAVMRQSFGGDKALLQANPPHFCADREKSSPTSHLLCWLAQSLLKGERQKGGRKVYHCKHAQGGQGLQVQCTRARELASTRRWRIKLSQRYLHVSSSEEIVRRNLEKPLHRHLHHHRPELPLAACSLSLLRLLRVGPGEPKGDCHLFGRAADQITRGAPPVTDGILAAGQLHLHACPYRVAPFSSR